MTHTLFGLISPALKSFIAEIEIEAQAVDPNVQNADLGIRFYYAAYPDAPVQPVPSDYARRHTLVMIPTKKEQDLNYDFNPFEGKALACNGRIGFSSESRNSGSSSYINSRVLLTNYYE
ncbi:hypothetical protein [Chryseobacterium indoltheticum]|uniref:hypothetical protein n=1 Tax=Chryseobacterium indoltheticum TaxID=254 RepID=UPI003F49584D